MAEATDDFAVLGTGPRSESEIVGATTLAHPLDETLLRDAAFAREMHRKSALLAKEEMEVLHEPGITV